MSDFDEWRLELKGDSGDLGQLGHRFSHGTVRVWRGDDGRWWLRSGNIQLEKERYSEAREQLEQVLVTLNGLAKLRDPAQGAVTPGGMVRIDSEGRQHEYLKAQSATVRVRGFPATISAGGEPLRGDEEAQQLAELAAEDRDVAQVLSHLAGEENWFTLSYIYEIIVDKHLNKQQSQAVKRGWVTEAEISNYWRTANWYETPGGRHAVPKKQPPEDPMSLGDARVVIRKLATGWLRERLADHTSRSAQL